MAEEHNSFNVVDLGARGLNKMTRLVAKVKIVEGEETASFKNVLMPSDFTYLALLTPTIAVNGEVFVIGCEKTITEDKFGHKYEALNIWVKGGDILPAGEYTLIFLGVDNLLNTGDYPQHEHMYAENKKVLRK